MFAFRVDQEACTAPSPTPPPKLINMAFMQAHCATEIRCRSPESSEKFGLVYIVVYLNAIIFYILAFHAFEQLFFGGVSCGCHYVLSPLQGDQNQKRKSNPTKCIVLQIVKCSACLFSCKKLTQQFLSLLFICHRYSHSNPIFPPVNQTTWNLILQKS